MVQVRTQGTSYLHQFEAFRRGIGSAGPEWLQRVREEGLSRFEATGFPTTRHEDWKYTNVAPIARANFLPAWDCPDGALSAAEVGTLIVDRPGWSNLLFLNGSYAEEFSFVSAMPDGVVVGSLAEALAANLAPIQQHLAQYASYQDNGFTALNTAFLRDGAFVYVPPGTSLESPIHLVFVSGVGEEAVIAHPRNLIILGDGSGATVVENYISLVDGPSFTNTVTEVVLGDGTNLDYYKLQRESQQSFHVGTTQVYQGRESQFSSFHLDLGARLGRNNLNMVLDADGGSCTLNGLYISTGQQLIDNHTTVDHLKSYTRSRQMYKGILDGKSRAVFNGKVIARNGTHQVDAHQTSRNLLLSDHAQVSTKPQLEIFADDLKCTHGATVGQLDEEAVFYLNSRGISTKGARRFLTNGFARDVLSRIKSEEVAKVIEEIVLARLRDGLESLAG